MEIVFGDAFYFIALVNQSDEYHEAAVEATTARSLHVVTTDYVLLEFADAFAATPQRIEIRDSILALAGASSATIVPASQQLFDAGLTLYAKRRDKQWSLTDCISFVVMRERGIHAALTHDHHFEQAGFKILL